MVKLNLFLVFLRCLQGYMSAPSYFILMTEQMLIGGCIKKVLCWKHRSNK